MSLTSTLFALFFTLSNPGGPGGPGGEGHPPKPPPEAIEACSDLSSGDACEFSGRNGERVEGSCWSPNSDLPLACRPANAPPPPRDDAPSQAPRW